MTVILSEVAAATESKDLRFLMLAQWWDTRNPARMLRALSS